MLLKHCMFQQTFSSMIAVTESLLYQPCGTVGVSLRLLAGAYLVEGFRQKGFGKIDTRALGAG